MNLKTMVGRTQLIRKAKSNARIIRDELAVRSQLKSRPAVEELDPQQREVSRVNHICQFSVNQFCRFTSSAWPRCWAASVR